jgi:hypothetical protein
MYALIAVLCLVMAGCDEQTLVVTVVESKQVILKDGKTFHEVTLASVTDQDSDEHILVWPKNKSDPKPGSRYVIRLTGTDKANSRIGGFQVISKIDEAKETSPIVCDKESAEALFESEEEEQTQIQLTPEIDLSNPTRIDGTNYLIEVKKDETIFVSLRGNDLYFTRRHKGRDASYVTSDPFAIRNDE